MEGELKARYVYDKVEVEEYDDGVYVGTGVWPFYAEFREAEVQIFRDKDGKIVAIDLVYKDE